MFLNAMVHGLHKFLLGLTILLLAVVILPSAALAQQVDDAASGRTGAANGVPTPTYRICDPPPVCFASDEARRAWAAQNQCRFLADVCSKTTPEQDHRGARPEDRGFWGNLWDGIESQLVYGYQFVKGLLTGLKDQIADLYHLITDIEETVRGLVALGRAFHDDPEGTLRTLAGLLGQGAVDAITRATQCGAYDLGLVIGQHVNPAIMLRLATRLSRYGDDLADAVSATRRDFHCASFAAGTPILTNSGRLPIERIRVGEVVLSRYADNLTDAARNVTDVFSRNAGSHRVLRTEFDTLRVTDEHPFWVQGKGWTQAKDVAEDDIVAGHEGDALVLSNVAVGQPLQVFNFSVDGAESYFVGAGGSWAHNAKCKLVPGGGLAAHEIAGGHLIEKHVGKTDQELRDRLRREPHIKASSSFPDLPTAEYAVSEALRARKNEIDAYLNTSDERYIFSYTLPESVGVVALQAKPVVTTTRKIRIVLQKNPTLPTGYLILTAYPIP